MAGYLIANIEVTDAAKFQEYREKVTPLIEKFGGRYLVRGGDLRRLEGNLPLQRPTCSDTCTGAKARFSTLDYGGASRSSPKYEQGRT